MQAKFLNPAVILLFLFAGCLTDPVDRDSSGGIPTVNQLPGNTSDMDAGTADTGVRSDTFVPVPDTSVVPDTSALSCVNQDLGRQFPLTHTGTTNTLPDRFNDRGCGSNAAGSGEWILKWEAPQAGRYVFSTKGSGYDTILYALDGCNGTELACNDDADPDKSSKIELDLGAAEMVLLVVDGYAGDSGDFQLSISGIERACDNGRDDDGDGDIDCADIDCFSAQCAGVGEWPEPWSALEDGMLVEVNRYRRAGATCGGQYYGPVDPLEMDEVIRIAARLHSKDMADQDYFEHDSLDGREFDDRMEDAGYTGAYPWGENIQGGSETAEAAARSLMNSTDHCKNIMSSAYRVMGIGYAYHGGSTYRHYWTQDFGASH